MSFDDFHLIRLVNLWHSSPQGLLCSLSVLVLFPLVVLNVKTEVTQGRENSFDSQIQVTAHHGAETKQQGLEAASHMHPQ